MTRIVKNERSWAISLISDINLFVTTNTLLIKRAGGETTINTGTKTMFPDVILYGDSDQTNILQGWEIKLPDILITDENFINDAKRKARILNLNSFFIWNFTSGVLYVKDNDGHFQIKKSWNGTNHIKSREDVELYKSDWLRVIKEILIELNGYLLSGDILTSSLGDIISETAMMTIINKNKSLVSNRLQTGAISDTLMTSFLNVWWREVQEEYMSDEENMYDAYAKTLLLNWTNKFIFAHAMKKYHNPAFDIEKIDYNVGIGTAMDILTNISEQCDFYNIFKRIEYNTFIPDESWRDLVEFNIFLKDNSITTIEQKTLQTILENTVRGSQRTLIGQYTTPPLLAEILTRITIQNLNSNVLDPCCGTGTIPKSVLDYKKLGIDKKDAYSTTWGSDKYSFPLQISNISLTNTDSMNIPNKLFQSNLFDLKVGRPIDIVNPEDGKVLQFKVPKFDIILSNLPFVPFELIKDDEAENLQRIIDLVFELVGIKLNKRSDLYTYMVISLWEMLEDNGRLGIIISNSWLGTDSGKQFYEVIQHFYNVEQIFISGKGRWFENANVVTTILVLSKKIISSPNNEAITSFCVFNEPLSHYENSDIKQILIDSALLNKEIDNKVLQLKSYNQATINSILDMNVSLNSLFYNVGWLPKIKSSLIRLTEFFEVKRGERRGWDQMFYPENEHRIERQYIKKVLKNSKQINSFLASPDSDAFCCSLLPEELEELGHTGALDWIRRFENGVNGTGRPLPEVLKKANSHWYEMKDDSIADIVTSLNPDRRLFFARFDEPAFINQRLIGLKAKPSNRDLQVSHILLNTMIGMFYLEASGFGRGLGALDLSKKNLEKTFMLNLNLLSTMQKEAIIDAFEPIKNRDILSTIEELEQEDRLQFENVVLSSFGIEEYFDDIKNSLLALQSARLSVKF